MKTIEEEDEEFIQNRTCARREARFLTRWVQHAVAQRQEEDFILPAVSGEASATRCRVAQSQTEASPLECRCVRDGEQPAPDTRGDDSASMVVCPPRSVVEKFFCIAMWLDAQSS